MNGGWEVDIRVQLPDGSVVRERRKASASSKQAAQKWPSLVSACCSSTASRSRCRRRSPTHEKVIQVLGRRTARRANVKPGIHILRHTFCSHLAMRGAPARAIQELAGHQDLGTTQRYMHLSPAALDAAIRLLETGTDTARLAVEK